MQSLFWWWPRAKHLSWTRTHVITFYQTFYQKDPATPKVLNASEECWANALHKIGLEVNHDLTRPLTLNKVQQTIVSLPRGKRLKRTNSQRKSSKTLHLSWHPHSLRLSKVF
jgi:hypothetical protein